MILGKKKTFGFSFAWLPRKLQNGGTAWLERTGYQWVTWKGEPHWEYWELWK